MGYRAMAHNGMVRTWPKTRPGALGPSQHNLLIYRIFAILTLPKTSAFGKVGYVGSCLLLPHIIASLVLGRKETVRLKNPSRASWARRLVVMRSDDCG